MSPVDSSGTKLPLILHHGLAQWGEDWAKAGWLDLFEDRKVIVIDALGHGRSDRPSTRSAYSVEKRAEAMIQVTDQEGIDEFVVFGFSMGGRAAVELAVSGPDRVRGLIVGGMHGLKPSIDQRNLERRINVLRSNKWSLVERAVGARPEDGRNNDPEALALSTEAVLDWRGAEDRMSKLDVPSLVYCGTQDSLLEYAKRTAELIPECDFIELPSTTHAKSFYSSDEAKSAVRTFLSGNGF